MVCRTAGAQQELEAAEPDRFFRPPYVGGRSWIGVRLDRDPDWAEIAELCQDAYRVIAPARLVASSTASWWLPSQSRCGGDRDDPGPEQRVIPDVQDSEGPLGLAAAVGGQTRG